MDGIKIIKKSVMILLVLFVMFSILGQTTNASSIGETIQGADDFVSDGSEGTKISSDNLKDLSDQIYNVLLILGIAIAVIVGLVLGIQFMTGSIATKSKVKESLIPYITGCIVIFGAFGIWKLTVLILRNIQ